jgi:molybdopterin synthase catalytic subunit
MLSFVVFAAALLSCARLKSRRETKSQDLVRLIRGKLVVPSAQEFATLGLTGAVATFEGVTRDYFEDKQVIELEYEAYDSMAIKTINAIISEAKRRFDGLTDVTVLHRLGPCPVGETSLFVAATSSHRNPCLNAVPFLVNEIKRKVPIWKLERYSDGQVWKENPEFSESS